jgi:hypothetical protein
MDDEVFHQITRIHEHFADTKNYFHLLRHTTNLASRYNWFASRSLSMPMANLPSDVVQELVAQLLEEDIKSPTRRRLPEDVEIGKALRMQIRSKLSALFESRENRTLRRETDLAKDESEESFANSVFDSDALFRDKTEKIEHESRSAIRSLGTTTPRAIARTGYPPAWW